MLHKILNDLISLQTDGSVATHRQCVQYIKDYIRHQSPQCIIQCIPTNGKDNLLIGFNVAELKDIRSGVMLCGHLDVVGGKAGQFKPTVADGKIYGRGTTDMKGAIACYLNLISYFNTLKMPIILCFTCDEETEMQGIKDVCAFLQKQNIRPQLTILGEPTANQLGIQSTGIKSYKTIIKGISAHSSVPNKGINALFIAAKIVQELEKIAQKAAGEELYLNVGSLSGGGNIAVIPDKAEIEWGFRYSSEESAEKIVRQYQQKIAAVIKQYPTARIETVKTAEFLGYQANDKKQISDFCVKLQIKPTKLSYTSEAGYLAEIGQNIYLCGCGSIEQAHSENEHISIDDLETYQKLLRRFFVVI